MIPEQLTLAPAKMVKTLKKFREKRYAKEVIEESYIDDAPDTVLNTARKHIRILREENLIERATTNQKQYYIITEKGEEYIKIFENHKRLNKKLEEYLND